MSLDIDEIFPNLNSNIEKIGIVQLESLDFNSEKNNFCLKNT